MGARERNFLVDLAERAGHGPAARSRQDAWMSGDREGAAADLPPELIDAMALACMPAELDDRLAAFEAIGVTTLVAVPCGDRPAVVRTPAAAVGAAT